MKKLLFVVLILFSINCIVEAQNSVVVSDTRDVPSLPTDFNKEVRFEFKRTTIMNGPGSGTYSGLMTFAPWADNSGGLHHQLSFSDLGLHYRAGWPNNTTWGAWKKILIEKDGGKVGIGTDSPVFNLHVKSRTGNSAIMVETESGKKWKTQVGSITGNYYIMDYTRDSDKIHFTLTPDGNLGLGLKNPSAKLEVAGTIRAKEIKVESNGWPDFVFEDDYKLKSLDEVDQFIKERKHLPGVPSAKQMEKDGVGLAEMNKLLLQKVEELTLHLID
ncbi:hypothetical protein EYV94_28490, partial [Puteibacter caeruleilacunae]